MSGTPKNSADLAGAARKGGKHSDKRNKHKGRPCPNPPSAPTGVAITFKVREKKTHLEYSGKIKWNGVFTDEQGHKIPGGGVEIDHYEIQMMATTAAGASVDDEDGHPRVRRWHKKSVKGIKVSNATMISGVKAEFTTKKAHGFVVGEIVRVQDVGPAQYNGKWTVLSDSLSSTKFRANLDVAATKDLEDEGTVEGEPDPNYNIIVDHIANPKKYYRIVRVRAWDNKNCPSDWSDWTQPVKPSQEAKPEPPAPGFVSLTFDRKGGKKHNAFRGKVKISPVTFFDIPGGDDEDDMSRYHVRVQVSEDGLTDWRKHANLHARDKDTEQEDDANILLVFHNVRRRNFYRVFLSSTDRYNRKGNESGPFPSSVGVGVGGTPDPVQNVVITRPAPRRFVAKWDEPSQPEDIDYYKIEWWRRNPLTLMETNRSRNRNDVYRVPEADKGKTHFCKVYAVDEDNNESTPSQPGDSDEIGTFTGEEPGTIKKFAGSSTPTGWLRCNGQSVATAAEPGLFAVIGYTYGGSGANFLVPDFRRRHPRGVGTSQSLGENDGVIETERMDNHGDHKNHKHKHHHRNKRRDHSDDGGGDSENDASPHSHVINFGTTGSINQTDKAAGGGQAAGPNHQHNVSGSTNTGGQHHHGVDKASRRSPGSPFHGDYGQTAHLNHEDPYVDPGAGQTDVYKDSLVGGFRPTDGHSWDAGPTDSFGTAITIDEEGAASGHKRHGHLRVHFIIKT